MPRSSRMVGWAMNKAHGHNDIPTHRVVNRIGKLTGKFHFETPDLMQKLLEGEGIRVENDKAQDFSNILWYPK